MADRLWCNMPDDNEYVKRKCKEELSLARSLRTAAGGVCGIVIVIWGFAFRNAFIEQGANMRFY